MITHTIYRPVLTCGYRAPESLAQRGGGIFMRKPPPNKNTLESVKANFHNYYTIVQRSYVMTACWEWHKTDPTTGGYGTIHVSNKKWKAHRLAWTLFRGEIPAGLCVCHHCDNPRCANADHFFVGTRGDNVRDAESKNLIQHVKGVDHPLAKLTENDVRLIRSSYRPYSHTANSKTLAKQFGVAHSLISRILSRQSWPHVV